MNTEALLSALKTGWNAALEYAGSVEASDLHITPRQNNHEVVLRVGGQLSRPVELHSETGRSLIQSFKAVAKMNIAETRRPQDARLESGSIQVRLATHPTLHGENMVIRLLGKQARNSLADLNLTRTSQGRLKNLLQHTEGLILVSGATGSGKTTTLHAFLNELGKQAGKIATLEDPVEIINPNALQTDLSRLAHLDFASGLRSLMRQDPDTILVGEIRDTETAELALHAALTGHRVFASVHAPDCPGTLCRLQELGVRLSSLLNCLNGVVCQRLLTQTGGIQRRPVVEILNLRALPRQTVLDTQGIEMLIKKCDASAYWRFEQDMQELTHDVA